MPTRAWACDPAMSCSPTEKCPRERGHATQGRIVPSAASIRRAALYGFLVMTLLGGTTARAVDVNLKTIDGTSLSGMFEGITDSSKVRLVVGGESKIVSFEDIAALSFMVEPVAPTFDAVFTLTDGSRIPGKIVREAADGIVCRLSVVDEVTLSFDQLAGVRFAAPASFPKAASLYEDTLAARRPGRDVVVSRSDDAARAVPGRLKTLDASGGVIKIDMQDKTFRLEKVYGIVFAGNGHAGTVAPLTVHLSDGTALSIATVTATADTVRVAAAAGFRAELPIGRIQRMRVNSDRVRFLSDMPTIGEKMSGLLHGNWPVRRDRSVSGGAILLDGRRFEKGLGVHSHTELLYEIDGAYDTFVATIGIDDYVRPAGNVVFRVLGDERMLFESGEVTGADDPAMVRVDVRGVRTLALVVDYGAGLDLSDHADWAGARLIRPASQSQ